MEEIIEVIQNKIHELEYEISQPRFRESYYERRDAQIDVLEEILRTIQNLKPHTST